MRIVLTLIRRAGLLLGGAFAVFWLATSVRAAAPNHTIVALSHSNHTV